MKYYLTRKRGNCECIASLQLEAARAMLALCRFNYDAMLSLMSPIAVL